MFARRYRRHRRLVLVWPVGRIQIYSARMHNAICLARETFQHGSREFPLDYAACLFRVSTRACIFMDGIFAGNCFPRNKKWKGVEMKTWREKARIERQQCRSRSAALFRRINWFGQRRTARISRTRPLHIICPPMAIGTPTATIGRGHSVAAANRYQTVCIPYVPLPYCRDSFRRRLRVVINNECSVYRITLAANKRPDRE